MGKDETKGRRIRICNFPKIDTPIKCMFKRIYVPLKHVSVLIPFLEEGMSFSSRNLPKHSTTKMRTFFGYIPLSIQVCPKKGINPTILLWGWDWDHQTYSREGYGSLGFSCTRRWLLFVLSSSHLSQVMILPTQTMH